jgi:hypothetical protein
LTGIDPARYGDLREQVPSGSIEPIGGESSISRGWTLTRISIDALLENKFLIVLPLVSTVILALISIVVFWGFNVFNGFNEITPEFILAIALMYFIAAVVMVFFNVALMGASMRWLEGGTPTLGYAIGFAKERLWVITQWALLVSAVNVLLSLIRSRHSNVGSAIAGISGIAWSVITFFAVPVVAFEKVTPFTAIKRSARLLRSTWKEAAISSFGMLFVFLMFAIIVLFPLIIALIWVGLDAGLVLLLISILYWIVLGSIYGAASSVLGTALYRYATTGRVPPTIPGTVIRNPWGF